MIHGVADGRREIHPSIRIHRKVLDGIRNDLAVADDGVHVVGVLMTVPKRPRESISAVTPPAVTKSPT